MTKSIDKKAEQVVQEHQWKPMGEYVYEANEGDETILTNIGANKKGMLLNVAKDIISLKKMKPNQWYAIKGVKIDLDIDQRDDLRNTSSFNKYLNEFRELGFDIGNNQNSEYGYKMPLPEKNERERHLIIFRRYAS